MSTFKSIFLTTFCVFLPFSTIQSNNSLRMQSVERIAEVKNIFYFFFIFLNTAHQNNTLYTINVNICFFIRTKLFLSSFFSPVLLLIKTAQAHRHF